MEVVDIESTRARLSVLGRVAAAVRRQFGLEWTRHGYQVLPRMRRMERRVRAPLEVGIHIVRMDAKAGTAIVEWEDAKGRLRQAELPQIALARHARRRRGDKG
jgi:hypothetical protein